MKYTVVSTQCPSLRSWAIILCTVLPILLPPSVAAQFTFGGNSGDDLLEIEVEESVEDSVEDSVGTDIEETVERFDEAAVEEAVEDQVVEDSEDLLTFGGPGDNQLEDSLIDDLAARLEANNAEAIEQETTEATEQQVVDATEEAVEDQVVDQSTEAIEADVDDDLVSGTADAIDGDSEGMLMPVLADTGEQRMGAEIDEMLEAIEVGIDVDKNRISSGHWLVMAEPSVFDELAIEGYVFDRYTELPSLGLRLAEVAAPSSFDISAARDGIIDVVGAGRAQVDLNHIYTAGIPDSVAVDRGVAPTEAMSFPLGTAELDFSIGVIDSAVDRSHPALKRSHIEQKSFTRKGAVEPQFHGTAIVSILSGNSEQMVGLAPSAQIYAASVFESDPKNGETASTVSLVRALDWLLSSNIDAVNLSLAGPANKLLQVALNQILAKGVVVVAAAGNGGPMAAPMYPAAYESVIAVTAVDAAGKVFRLANRGNYLDIAAPGVNVRHAVAGGGYGASSGTSFAVPFAATAAARLKFASPGVNVREHLSKTAVDIGAPGRDDIFGYGLLTP